MKFPFDLTMRPFRQPLPYPRPSEMQVYYPLESQTIIGAKQKDIVGEKEGTVSATLTGGKIGAGLQFNGIGQYFDTNYSPDILADGELTIAFWVKGAPGATGVILGLGNVFDDTTWNRLQFNWSTPKMRMYTKGDDENVRLYTTTATLLDNAFHSVVGIISPKENETLVYVDSVYDGGAAGALGAFSFEGWTIHGGCLNNDGVRGNYAAGFLDELMIVNKRWSPRQVEAYHYGRLLE